MTFSFQDELGPEKVLFVYEPRLGLRGILVVDNVAAGPAIGGIRMAPDADLDECFRLARAMTFKNAAAGLPHGGGKSVIVADPKMALEEKERYIRAFAAAIAPIDDYIPGPDMGTDETCMAWVKDETGRAAGLPPEIGGIPLDEIGATGLGLRAAIEAARDFCDLELEGARVVVQGFGSVGKHAAGFLAQRGARLVAASDSSGTVVDPDGLDVAALIAWKDSGASLNAWEGAEQRGRDAVIDVECEIWIPAARPDVLTADNVDRLKARVVAQGANIPATEAAERRLAERGVLSLPDFIANAGGVICASVEYHGGSQKTAFETIESKVYDNTCEVLERSRSAGILPRAAAREMAEERVKTAMGFRRRF
jgi:glutamate dehydrogenase/leucine dehydrogenase